MNIAAWKRFATYYRGLWPQVGLGVALAGIQSALLLPVGLLVRDIFDIALPAGDVRRLALLAASVFGIMLLQAGVQLVTRYVVLGVTKTAIVRLRTDLLENSYRLGRGFYTQSDVSYLHTRLVQDTERADVFSNTVVTNIFPGITAVVGLSIILIYLNPVLFIVLAAVLPPLKWLSTKLGRPVKQYTRAYHRAFEKFSRNVLLMLQAMDTIRLQAAEALDLRQQGQTLKELRNTSMRMAWLSAAYSQSQESVVALATLVILAVGGYSVAQGVVTLGELLAFYVVVVLIRGYLHSMTSAVPQLLAGSESLATLNRLLTHEDRVTYVGRRQIKFGGRLAFEDVTFGYGIEPVLEDVELELRPGQTTAIVGPNGAGKSTLAYLAVGLYRPWRGRVLADGVPLDDLDLAHLRSQIGVVLQDPFLFPGTVWENITYGNPDASQAAVQAAAEAATADDVIGELEAGYETVVGEKGVRLSGGQRQRLALARAMLRHPALLILDEPTNHLDQEAIARFMRRLRALPAAPAILIISHNADIISQADVVYRLLSTRLAMTAPSLATPVAANATGVYGGGA
jgi:ATP-binding cassette subfamily B protein